VTVVYGVKKCTNMEEPIYFRQDGICGAMVNELGYVCWRRLYVVVDWRVDGECAGILVMLLFRRWKAG